MTISPLPTIEVQYTCHNCQRQWISFMEWTLLTPMPTTTQFYWTTTCSVCTPEDGPDPQNIPKG